ncbi:hypothetical protein [Streptomyces sp. NBC_00280]
MSRIRSSPDVPIRAAPGTVTSQPYGNSPFGSLAGARTRRRPR